MPAYMLINNKIIIIYNIYIYINLSISLFKRLIIEKTALLILKLLLLLNYIIKIFLMLFY